MRQVGLVSVAQHIPGRKNLPSESTFYQLGRGPFRTICTTKTDPWCRTTAREQVVVVVVVVVARPSS